MTPTPRHQHATNWNEFFRFLEMDCRDLLSNELRDIGANRVYIIDRTEGRFHFDNIQGFTSSAFSRRYRKLIGDRFTGHAPGMYVAAGGREEFSEEARLRVVTTCVHEIGHWFQSDVGGEMVTWAALEANRIGKGAELTLASIKTQAQGYQDYDGKFIRFLEVYRQHRRDFIRIAVNVAERAKALGWQFNDDSLCPFGWFGIGYYFHFELLLAEDVERFMCMPFTKLPEIPEPDKYRSFWDSRQQQVIGRLGEVLEQYHDIWKQELSGQATTSQRKRAQLDSRAKQPAVRS